MGESWKWTVATSGYAWSGPEETPVLTPCQSWPIRLYAPLFEQPGLFLEFANLELNRESALKFANRYGQLGIGQFFAREPLPAPEQGEPSRERRTERVLGDTWRAWQDEQGFMRVAVKDWQQLTQGGGEDEEVESLLTVLNQQLRGRVVPLLTPDAVQGGFKLDWRPVSLIGALWLQLAHAVSQNQRFRPCDGCGAWLEESGQRSRWNLIYCSDACRMRTYRRRQEEAVALHAAGKTYGQIAQQFGTDAATVKKWVAARKER